MADHLSHFESTFGGVPTGTISIDAQMALDEVSASDVTLVFLLNEVKSALKSLPTCKAPGCDEIWAEMLINATDCINGIFLILFNRINATQTVPNDWKIALVCPIYNMKGEISEIKNYRPVSLTCISRRLYKKILQKSLVPLMY